MSITQPTHAPSRYVWELPLRRPGRHGDSNAVDGAVLAALRRGVGREPGTVPQMWPYYRELNAAGALTNRLRAEHLALTLFGVHQQSKSEPMHRRNISIGAALGVLRLSGRFSQPAVESRFAACATATSLAEASQHLRRLVTQLKVIDQGLDYTLLMRDLVAWQRPEGVGEVRRRWGMQFFIGPASTTEESS